MSHADTMLARAAHEMRMKVRLTDRWTPLKPHAMQSLYVWSPVRFKLNPSGRRSGKTENAKRKGVLRLIRKSTFSPAILFGAPTYGQAHDIYWEDLKALIPEHWKANTNETRMEIRTHWGALLRIFGFDRPRRMEGVPWDLLILDETADCPRGCFARNISPALATVGREGSADLIGVPDEVGRNQAEYEELYEIGLRWSPDLASMPAEAIYELKADPDMCSYWWPSSDILSEKEMTSQSRRLDEFSLSQEFGGKFIRSGGKVAPRFDTKMHVNERFATWSPRLPLDWTLDFGTRWCASLIGQVYKGSVWIMDEIALADSSTDVAADVFLERVGERGWPLNRLRIFGDAAGQSAHSNIGKSDYEILEGKIEHVRNVEWLQLTHAPLVKDTVNMVRSRLVTADGVIHLHIHPRCVRLIQDLKTAPWPDGSNNLKDYHWLAALRYYLWALFGESHTLMGATPADSLFPR